MLAIYLVGGSVRDQLLGRPLYDLDLAVSGDGLALARRLAIAFRAPTTLWTRNVARAGPSCPDPQAQRLIVDVARFRGTGPSAPTLATDLADRDFTINALASDVRTPQEVIDLHGGLADLEAHSSGPSLRRSSATIPCAPCGPSARQPRLDFSLAPETAELIRRDGSALAQVSGERIRDELARLLALSQAAASCTILDDLGILTIILPELEPLRGLAQPLPHHLARPVPTLSNRPRPRTHP